MKNLILMLTTALFYCLACQTVPDQQPPKSTIEQHLDRVVRVFGSWTAVKLPISSGMTIWNPVQIVRGPGEVMFVANNTGEIYSLHDTTGDGLEDHAELSAM